MSVLALDWNATRVSAVLGDAGREALPIALDPPSVELPLAVALGGTLEVGTSALRRARVEENAICQAFLPFVSDKPGQGPSWQSGRFKLDARGACEKTWRKLQGLAVDAKSIVLTVPDYLRPAQAATLCKIGEKLKLPIVGSIPSSLAIGLASFGAGEGKSPTPWTTSLLAVDVDEHALTFGWLKSLGDKAHIVESRSLPHLGLRVWRERLVSTLSDLFVLEHRRDPRDSPQAEQSLFDQLDILTDAALGKRSLQIAVQGRAWFKHLLVHPKQTVHFCSQLAHKAVTEAEQLLYGMPSGEWPPAVVFTHAAGRLPGLVQALESLSQIHPSAETKIPQLKATELDDDFGESLVLHDETPNIHVRVLRPEAPAQSAHRLAEVFRTGKLARGHLEMLVPLPTTARNLAV